MRGLHACLGLVLVVSLASGIAPAFAQEDPLFEDPALEETFKMSGSVEGTGTSFEITGSEYLNITLESSQPVNLWMESVPETVTYCIEAAEGATSAQITLSGLLPSTTYYKYEDDFHHLVTVATDATGAYTYSQDLSQPHLVFVQTQPSTIFIPSDTTVGTWNPATRKYKLSVDVNQTIQIDEDNLTLDGAGYTVAGGSSVAVFVPNPRTGVTIQDLTITTPPSYSAKAIYVLGSGNTITGNTVNGSIVLGSALTSQGSNNAVTRNTVSNAQHSNGITVWGDGNVLTDNTVSNTVGRGIWVFGFGNTLADNIVSNNGTGVYLNYGTGNVLTGNTLSGNRYQFSATAGQAIDTSNTADGRPIYYLDGATGGVYDSSTNAGVFIAHNCSGLTVDGLTPLPNGTGLYLSNVNNSTIVNNTVEGSVDGIYLQGSGNDLTGNTASNNRVTGIWLSGSDNTLTDNTTSHNAGNPAITGEGMFVFGNANRLINNVALNNSRYGISLGGETLTLAGNIMSGNGVNLFFADWPYGTHGFDHNIDATNMVNGQPVYYVKNVVGEAYDGATNAGVFYAVNCDNITIKDLSTASNNHHGVALRNTTNSTIENVIVDSNIAVNVERSGIELRTSNGNQVIGNSVSGGTFGIALWDSHGNSLRNNRISNSNVRVFTSNLNGNYIYNNNFFNSAAIRTGGDVNTWYSGLPLGGNFWSDWTSPDDDGNWFVDYPYEIQGPYNATDYDYLPWTIPDGWKATPEAVSVGSEVTVSPTDPNTGVSVSLTFDNVTVAGETMVTTSELEGVMDPPEGYRIGASNTIFFISTTATYNGSILIAVPYTTEPDPALFHYVDGAWVDVTQSVDTVNKIIYGLVDSLSPFAVFEPNTVPEVQITAPASGQLVPIGQEFTLEGVITDPDDYDWHTAVWNVTSADGITDYELVGTVDMDLVSDLLTLRRVGIYSISLSVTDSGGAVVDASTVYPDDLPAYVVVYDPSAGHVTGGGWIYSPAGALDYGFDPATEGKATFGFVAKYEQGATAPTGNTEFNFHAGGLKFTSTSYDWLVVAGTKAQFKGDGTIEGLEGSYKFMLTAVDGGDDDRFRIKIWDPATDIVVYDNKRGFDDNAELDSSTMIGGGSIIVHKN